MSPWIKYECGCIEGPVVSGTCSLHGKRGVAELINCIKNRPITCWITNGECDERRFCPSTYDDCKYKFVGARRAVPAQRNLL